MKGDRPFGAHPVVAIAAAGVALIHILHAVLGVPVAHLEVADDQRAGAFGDFYRIADMIAMRVRQQDDLCVQVFGSRLGHGVAADERVDQDFVPVDVQCVG